MKREPLGRTLKQIAEEQPSFDFLMVARKHDPPSSHEAAESMTASGKREKHRQIIIGAMVELKATPAKPCTGLQIANASGLTNVEVMRRLRVDLAYPGIVKSTDMEKRIKCPVDGRLKLGWWIVKQ